jgi:hypothetical protein
MLSLWSVFRPERTRISYFAKLTTATYAALRKESRRHFINATELNRKSGVAQWRDLRFYGIPRKFAPMPFAFTGAIVDT